MRKKRRFFRNCFLVNLKKGNFLKKKILINKINCKVFLIGMQREKEGKESDDKKEKEIREKRDILKN